MSRTSFARIAASVLFVAVAIALIATPRAQEAAVDDLDKRASELFEAGQYAEALDIAEQRAAAIEKTETQNGRAGALTAEALGDVARYALFAEKPERALAASERAMTLAPNVLVFETNRAHALLFLGRTQEAIAEYIGRKGEAIPDKGKWEEVILEDFAAFRERGLDHPDMSQVEKALAEAQAQPSAEVVPQIGHTGTVSSMIFSPDGRYVLTAGEDKALKLWDFATDKLIRTWFPHHKEISIIAFSSNGRMILSGGEGDDDKREFKLWDIATGSEVKRSRTQSGEPTTSQDDAFFDGAGGVLAVSPSGRMILTEEYTERKLWDASTGQELRSLGEGGGAQGKAVFSADERLILTDGPNNIPKLWDVETGKEVRSFRGHDKPVTAVALSADGKLGLSGSEDETIRLWNLETGQELRSIKVESQIDTIEFSPDGRLALSHSLGDEFQLWDLATGKAMRSLEPEGKQEPIEKKALVLLSRTHALFVRQDDEVIFLSVTNRGRGARQGTLGKTNSVSSVASSPDGRLVAIGSADKVQLWDLTSGKKLRDLTGHQGPVNCVAFSPDGQAHRCGRRG